MEAKTSNALDEQANAVEKKAWVAPVIEEIELHFGIGPGGDASMEAS